MSLINKMLRDLDARHAPNVDRTALPGALHALQPDAARSWPKVAVGLAVVAALAGYFVFKWPTASSPPLPPVVVQVPVAPPPAPVAASPIKPEILPEPPAVPVPPATAEETPAPAPVTVAAKPKTVVTGKLRLDPKPPAAKEAAAADTTSARPPATPPRPAAEPVSTEPSAIDKRPRTAPANEAAETEYRKAMSALRRGATNEAIDGLRSALRLERLHASARQALLSLLIEQQQWNEAQALMEEGLALDPAQTGWAMALARLQLEHGKLQEASETLGRHAAHAEQNADYQAFHALLLQRQKRPADAAQRYRVALALKPNESRWWYGLGLVLESEHKTQEARGAFLKARETGNLSPELAAVVDQRLR